MIPAGSSFGLVGALAAFPRRLAAREIALQGGKLHRKVIRQTQYVVFGRGMLDRLDATEIEARLDEIEGQGKFAISEVDFLVHLKLSRTDTPSLSEEVILSRSGLTRHDMRMLELFDAFESKYTFRDLVRAKSYAGLIAEGADWLSIARSIKDGGNLTAFTRLSVTSHRGRIFALRSGQLSEIDGQTLLPFDVSVDEDLDACFTRAEQEEASGSFLTSIPLYERCLSLDPSDAVSAFNLANCYKAVADFRSAAHAYARAIKLEPKMSEAWFNFADLLRTSGKIGGARHHLLQALKIDPAYADAIYNLAALEYEAGQLRDARRWWTRYLLIDKESQWAKTAARGIEFVDIELRRSSV